MKPKASQNIQYAACVFEISSNAAGEIQLLPAGQFRAADGRPFDAPFWRMDETNASMVVARALAKTNRLVLDYEHQTLNAEWNGQPAPAAGWFKALEFRPGIGLFATDVEWTARASEYIAAGEYKYISPVFTYLPDTGEVLEIKNAALTNFPALDGMTELLSRAAARYATEYPQQEEVPVNEEQLKLLGLAKDATAEQVTAALTALKSKADDAETRIAALTAQAGQVDPAKYVPVKVVEDMRGEIAALSAKITGDEVDSLVKTGLVDGRLLPAQEQWARDLGTSNIAALKGYLASAQPIAALRSGQTSGKAPAGEPGALDDDALAVCRQMGIAPDDYKKTMA